MDGQEEQLRAARRVRFLKRVLIVLLPLSVLGTYFTLRYSYLLANEPIIIQSYADPVLATFLIWSFYGLMLILSAYYSRLHKLLSTKQMLLLAIIFIIYPILSYIYILGLWLLNRPHEIEEEEVGADKGQGSVATNRSDN